MECIGHSFPYARPRRTQPLPAVSAWGAHMKKPVRSNPHSAVAPLAVRCCAWPGNGSGERVGVGTDVLKSDNDWMEEIGMEFRPCIDIHNGKVKQIVGGSLRDEQDQARENFVSEQDAGFYARFYQARGLRGGHIVLLNKKGSRFYEETRRQALLALSEYPGGLQVGGGICRENAGEYLEAGASHVIVTSYVFRDGKVDWDNLRKLQAETGKEHLVLDLSCRRKEEAYYIVTDRWQKFTDVVLTKEVLTELSGYCAEFLVHAVDAEGKAQGIEEPLVSLLGAWDGIPITYAGGVGNFSDLRKLKDLGKGRLNVTIGSALDLFGGTMNYEEVVKFVAESPK